MASGIEKGIGRLHFLTMDEGPMGHLEQVEAACAAGIRWIQLRMKQVSEAVFLETAFAAKKICGEWGAKLILNDRVEAVPAVGADGVHLGKQDLPPDEARRLLGPDLIIGGTANTAEDILAAVRKGADYIGLGPYRHTTTKKKLSPLLGPEGVTAIMDYLREERVAIPVIAVGGIRAGDGPALRSAGVYGVAFSGLLVHAEDRRGMIESLEEQMWGGGGLRGTGERGRTVREDRPGRREDNGRALMDCGRT